jgi:predicted transglutaminase-like cysteine proteinase
MQGVHAFARKKIIYRREPEARDIWQKPADTLATGHGDCEDICIVERCLLLNAGYRDSDIELMVVQDLVTRETHALLWVKEHYLDNRYAGVLHVSQFKDYRPITGHRAGESFLYGKVK